MKCFRWIIIPPLPLTSCKKRNDVNFFFVCLYLASDGDGHLSSEFCTVTFIGRKSSPEDVMAIHFAHGRRSADTSGMTGWRPPFVLVISRWWHNHVASGHREMMTRNGRIRSGWLMTGFWTWRCGFAVFTEAEHGTETFQKESSSVGVLLFTFSCLVFVVQHWNSDIRWRSWRWHHFIHLNLQSFIHWINKKIKRNVIIPLLQIRNSRN